MAYNMTFMNKMLKKNRDDAKKAEVYDEMYPTWNAYQKRIVDRLFSIGASNGFGVNGAKAFAVNFLVFFQMSPDEQEMWVAHGKAILAEYEWACARKTRKQIQRELEEAQL